MKISSLRILLTLSTVISYNTYSQCRSGYRSITAYADKDLDSYRVKTQICVYGMRRTLLPSGVYSSPGLGLESAKCDLVKGAYKEIAPLYIDKDGDGYHDPSITNINSVCVGSTEKLPYPYTMNSLGTDCDDSDPSAHVLVSNAVVDSDEDGSYVIQELIPAACSGALPILPQYQDCDDTNNELTYSIYNSIDADGDNYFVPSSSPIYHCSNVSSAAMYSSIDWSFPENQQNQDTDDNDPSSNPGAQQCTPAGEYNPLPSPFNYKYVSNNCHHAANAFCDKNPDAGIFTCNSYAENTTSGHTINWIFGNDQICLINGMDNSHCCFAAKKNTCSGILSIEDDAAYQSCAQKSCPQDKSTTQCALKPPGWRALTEEGAAGTTDPRSCARSSGSLNECQSCCETEEAVYQRWASIGWDRFSTEWQKFMLNSDSSCVSDNESDYYNKEYDNYQSTIQQASENKTTCNNSCSEVHN